MAIKLIVYLSLTLLSFLHCSSQKKIKDPYSDFVLQNKIEAADSVKNYLHRIIFDFNGDGRRDVAISYSGTWGNGGGTWLIYFKQIDESYTPSNELFFHPLSTSFQPGKNGGSTIICYQRESCCEGYIVYYSIHKKRFTIRKTKHVKVSDSDDIDAIVNRDLRNGRALANLDEIADLGCIFLQGKNNCWQKTK